MYVFTMTNLEEPTCGVFVTVLASVPQTLDELLREVGIAFERQYQMPSAKVLNMREELIRLPMGEALADILAEGATKPDCVGLIKKSSDGKMLLGIQAVQVNGMGGFN